jgi:hypothetical protein
MQGKIRTLLLVALIAGKPAAGICQTSNPNQGFAKMGVSQVNITPDQPVIMSGYDARKTPSTGIHDSIFASALYFSTQQNKALVITADLIGFPTLFVDTLKKSIAARTKMAPEDILIIAEHNHGGPAIHVYEGSLPRANEEYIASLREKIVTLAADAMKKQVSFRMGVGKGICRMNINRRALFADGGVWLGRNLDGPCDQELDVVKFVDEDNHLLAALVNWPCHGTASGQDNYELTGDWPASAARFIRKSAGKNLVVAISAGASANINPIYGPGNDFNEVEAIGYHVADEAWRTIQQTETFPVKSLQVLNAVLSYPGKKGWKDQFPQTSIESGSDVQLRISALKLGDLVLCGISGELMTEMGLEIKKESPFASTIIVTHCNGSSGYICTDKAYTEGGYEPKVSHLMPGVEKLLVGKSVELIRSF